MDMDVHMDLNLEQQDAAYMAEKKQPIHELTEGNEKGT